MGRSHLILSELVSGRGTARRVVEGKARHRLLDDVAHDGNQISQHLPRRNPQRPNIGMKEIRIAQFIVRRPIAARMCFAVYLDRQSRIAAEKVEDVGTAGVLATEFEAARPCSKHLPQQHFWQAHGAAQLASARDAASFSSWRDIFEQPLSPPSVLRTATSPRQARGGTRRNA